MLEYLADEYRGKGILNVGVAPTVYSRQVSYAHRYRPSPWDLDATFLLTWNSSCGGGGGVSGFVHDQNN